MSGYQPGPPVAVITPRDRSRGSVPPFHFYDVHELPRNDAEHVVAFLTVRDRKGSVQKIVRL